jgi:hypothetical protein
VTKFLDKLARFVGISKWDELKWHQTTLVVALILILVGLIYVSMEMR